MCEQSVVEANTTNSMAHHGNTMEKRSGVL